MFEWYQKYCGYCMAGDDDAPDCACDSKGRFEITNMPKCKPENCTPLKEFAATNTQQPQAVICPVTSFACEHRDKIIVTCKDKTGCPHCEVPGVYGAV